MHPTFSLYRTVIVALVVCAGCSRETTLQRRHYSGQKITFETEKWRLVVEVACEDAHRQKGLMDVQPGELGENEGMLFIYERSASLSFYMRNTYIPLSIAFLGDEGEILEILDLTPRDETSRRSKYQVKHALEVNQGWFQRHGLKVGDRLPDFQAKVKGFDVR
jgi:uncharacterized membrane protein (UPF0127 family)